MSKAVEADKLIMNSLFQSISKLAKKLTRPQEAILQGAGRLFTSKKHKSKQNDDDNYQQNSLSSGVTSDDHVHVSGRTTSQTANI